MQCRVATEGGDEGGWALRAQTSSPEPVFFGPKSMVVVPERLSTSVRVLSSTYAHTTWKTCSERDDKRKRKWTQVAHGESSYIVVVPSGSGITRIVPTTRCKMTRRARAGIMA